MGTCVLKLYSSCGGWVHACTDGPQATDRMPMARVLNITNY